MPTTRRRRLQRAREPISDAVRHYLRTGDDGRDGGFDTWLETFVVSQFLRGAIQDGVAFDVWVELRDQIVSEHIQAQPGTRPHGWWCCDAPAARECTGLDPKLRVPAWMWRMRRGVPYEAYTLKRGTVLALESEAHFLRRHALLESGERERVPLTSYEAEVVMLGEAT